ncbi:MAG: ABC transporter ATP-binding protein [Rhodospirillaceae bacterium]|jgi:lipoprotein-releasing system ATP-binding protein|nr:ABC transporter ATP-binding protein [Rhodospirillaceae bacterium]MBT5564149.1 ABC transporter ATP-binding protein [Rhodospirillaceae bacterium]MBT6089944.1 ABC transporter ATP-binding protein [Rhodospirillaceae bacterium]MBT6961011.1 ABC transporter ATP-binding protein [Rhodospirillaceae bacterium]
MSSDTALVLENVRRTFEQGGKQLEVLRGANLTVVPGEIVALVGPSGSGKSTLLHLAGLLEKPDTGDVFLAGERCGDLAEHQQTALRLKHLGFVYQYHHLLPEFSAVENVVVPQMIAGVPRDQAAVRAKALLDSLGLSDRYDHRPGILSGGEQQRVAIARALANTPALLLADEPTGNLDPHTAEGVFDALLKLSRDHGLAALVATHNPDLAKRMDRIVRLDEGVLIEG